MGRWWRIRAGGVVPVAFCLLTACGAPPDEPPDGSPISAPPATVTPQATPSSSGAPSASAEATLADLADLEVKLDGGPDWPTTVDGALWVLLPDSATAEVASLDPTTGAPVTRVAAGGRRCEGMVAAFDSLWVCAPDGTARIDPTTSTVVATVAHASAPVIGRPAASEDAVWVLAGDGAATSVVRIDPVANAVTATYELGHVAGGIAYGSGAIWVTSPADGLLLRLDPTTGEITEAQADLPAPTWVAASADAVWVILYGTRDGPNADGAPAVLRYEPGTGESTLIDVGGSPGIAGDLLTADDAIWVRGSESLVRLDAASGEIAWSAPQPGMGEGSLGLGEGVLWVTSVDRGTLWRIDVDAP